LQEGGKDLGHLVTLIKENKCLELDSKSVQAKDNELTSETFNEIVQTRTCQGHTRFYAQTTE